MFTEIEAKLHIRPNDVPLFLKHPVFKHKTTSKPTVNVLKNTYFDNETHDLRRHSYSLRIREIGHKRIQTLKSAGKRNGRLRQRKEWEHKISRKTPDLTLLDDSRLTIHLLEILKNKPLIPLFTTSFKRTSWKVNLGKDTLVELDLDQGVINTEDASLIISEIEIELIEGNPDQISKLVDIFLKTLPVTHEDRSKSSRGYKLYML